MAPAVLITGGAKRIGAALSRAFADSGWHVVIHSRGADRSAQDLADTLPSAEVVSCDLGDGNAALAMIAALAERHEDWRALVNCAAIFRPDSAHGLDPAVFDETMIVNARTPASMAQAYLRLSRAKAGRRVIAFLDQKLRNPNPDFFSYTMAKHAFAASVKMMAMAQEQAEDRVYGLAPGAILPSFDQNPHEHEVSGRMNLLDRLTDPHELAEAALFLAQGWLASGETIFIDSGQHLLAQPRDVLYLARQ